MRRYWRFLVIALFGFVISSCASTAPTEQEMLKILDSLETEVNEEDLEGVMALFAEDAVWVESYRDRIYEGVDNIDFGWWEYFMSPVTGEFSDISVEGDTATFTWVETRPGFTKIWKTIIVVENGKITRMEFPEDAVRESVDLE